MKFVPLSILFSLFLLVLPAAGLAEELTSEKEAAIVRLMEITGSKDIGLQMGNAINQSLANALRSGDSDVPELAYQILSEETNRLMEENIDDLMVKIIPIYHTYFTEKEIDQLLAFYETPVGKKTIAVLPQVLNDSMVAGQTWGQQMVPKLLAKLEKRFKEEGLEIPE